MQKDLLEKIFIYEVNKKDGHICIKYNLDSDAFSNICEKNLGKAILFTNNYNWSWKDNMSISFTI